MQVSPDFTHAALAAGTMAVLPVARNPNAADFDDAQLGPIRGQLLSQLRERREEVKVVSADAVDRAVQDLYPEAPLDFAAGRSIDPERITALGRALGAQFVVLTRMDSYGRRKSSDFRTDEERDKKGKVVRQTEIDILTHEGTLTGALTVYKTVTGTAAWEGMHVVSDTNKIENPRPDTGGSLGRALMNVVADVAIDTALARDAYPEPPTASELSQALFSAFLKNWPEEE
jgi:hypothetical protein